MAPVTLGSKWFPTKKAAWAFVKRYIEEAEYEKRIPIGDMVWIEPLFRTHPTPGKLAGWDGRSVTVTKNEYGQRVFALCMPGSKPVIIGAKKCIDRGLLNGPNTVANIARLARQQAAKDELAHWEAAAVAAMEANGM